MLDAPSTPRALAARRVRDVDVYGGANAEAEAPRPNLFAVIWRRRWIVLSCVLLGIVGGIAYYVRATPIFAASSTVYVQDNALKIVNDPMAVGNRSQSYLFTQCQLITSSAILTDALNKPAVANVKSLREASNPVGFLKSAVTAVPDKFSDLIYVSIELPSASDAATLVNAVVEAYVDYQARSHKSTAVDVIKVLQKGVAKYEDELAKKQKAVLDLKQNNPDLAFNSGGGSIIASELGKLSATLTDAQLRSLRIKTAVAVAETVKDDPAALKQVIDQSQISSEQETTGDPETMAAFRSGRQRLDDLLDRLGPKHDMVRSAEKQVARMQQELQQATRDTAASYLSMLKQSQRIADDQVTALQKVMDANRENAIKLNLKQAEFEALIEDERRLMRYIDQLDTQQKQVNVNEDVGSLTVNVLETAKAGFSQVRPLLSKILSLGLVAGLMGGVGLAMLRDLVDQRLRSADEITSLLELPILGTVPHILTKGKGAQRGRLVQMQPRSNVSESYRTIRTALSFGSGDGKGNKTILFTSPAPGDGKSTCVSNLALAFAQSGRRTLLIDADCRRPTQDRTFELADGAGLSDVLSGASDLPGAIRTTETEKLDILPCGSIPHNPAELLDSQALLDLLGQVTARYDQILIDSPPVIAVTDARILAASCDASVLVLRADRSTRRLAEHARDALQSVGANLLGVIVNDVPRGKSGYGYDYYGNATYGYQAVPGGRAVLAADNGMNGAMAVPSDRTIAG